jgi:hypothetical protein
MTIVWDSICLSWKLVPNRLITSKISWEWKVVATCRLVIITIWCSSNKKGCKGHTYTRATSFERTSPLHSCNHKFALEAEEYFIIVVRWIPHFLFLVLNLQGMGEISECGWITLSKGTYPANWWCVFEAEDKNIHRNVQSFALLDIIPVRNIDNKFVGASPSKLVLRFSYIMPQNQGRQFNFMSHITPINIKGVGRGVGRGCIFKTNYVSNQGYLYKCKCWYR